MKGKINDWSFYSLGDHALVFALAAKMDVLILQKIKQLNEFISTKNIIGILDIIPSYHTLTIVYDITTFLSATQTASEQLLNLSNNIINDFRKNNPLWACYSIIIKLSARTLLRKAFCD